MALDSKVFTPGNPPDHSAALMQIALNRPDVYKAFSKGYDDAQKRQLAEQQRQLALQQYRQAKMKADLAEQMYPGLLAEQQRQLQARMKYYDNPNQYTVQPSTIAGTPKPITDGTGDHGPLEEGNREEDQPTAPTPAPYPYQQLPSGLQLQQGGSQFPGMPNTNLGAAGFVPTTDTPPLFSSEDFGVMPT